MVTGRIPVPECARLVRWRDRLLLALGLRRAWQRPIRPALPVPPSSSLAPREVRVAAPKPTARGTDDIHPTEMTEGSPLHAARTPERACIAAILQHPAAADNQPLAMHLAFDTGLPRGQAIAALQAAASAAATQNNVVVNFVRLTRSGAMAGVADGRFSCR